MSTSSELYANLDAFREFVRNWMESNAVIPDEIPIPERRGPMSPQLKQWAIQFRRKLGAQGWIAPDWPRAYGGGGLSTQQAKIVQQELRRYRLPPLQVSLMHTTAIRVFGTEEQKTTILASVLRGEVSMVHAFNEIGHGSDMSANTTSAISDGDDYIINGRKDQITCILPPDLVLCLAVTNPDAPAPQRFSVLAVDANADGVLIKPESLLVPGREFKFFFTDAAVSKSNMVGKEGQGIEIAEFMVDMERGGINSVPLELQNQVEERERREHGDIP